MNKNHVIIGALVLVVLSLITYVVVDNIKGKDKQQSVVQQEDKTSTPKNNDSILADAELVNIGDTITFSTQTMKVNSVKAEKDLVHYGKRYSSQPGTKYLVVNMTITNTTDKPFYYEHFGLVNDDEKTILFTNDEAVYGEESLDGKTLNPSVPVTGDVTYIIPEAMTSTNIGGPHAETGKFKGVKLTF